MQPDSNKKVSGNIGPIQLRFKVTTDSKHNLPVAPNILKREFSLRSPSKVWVRDITYIPTDEGWLYLAGIKELFNGELVGYAMDERMTKSLVMQAYFVQLQVNIRIRS